MIIWFVLRRISLLFVQYRFTTSRIFPFNQSFGWQFTNAKKWLHSVGKFASSNFRCNEIPAERCILSLRLSFKFATKKSGFNKMSRCNKYVLDSVLSCSLYLFLFFNSGDLKQMFVLKILYYLILRFFPCQNFVRSLVFKLKKEIKYRNSELYDTYRS